MSAEARSIPELQTLLSDLRITCMLIMKSHLVEGEDLDIIAMSTATAHMLYLLQQDKPSVHVLYDARWNNPEAAGDELLHVLSALEFLAHPIAPLELRDKEMGWDRIVLMTLSNLLQLLLGKPTNFKDYCTCFAAICKMCAFEPVGRNFVHWELVDLHSASHINMKYTKRMH